MCKQVRRPVSECLTAATLLVHCYCCTIYDGLAADDDVSVSITTRFESGDRQQLSDALEAVKDSLTRVVVALMYDQDVELLYSIAEEKEMVGKGWTWIGPEWVADSTFAYAEDPATLRRVANGVVGTSTNTRCATPLTTPTPERDMDT